MNSRSARMRNRFLRPTSYQSDSQGHPDDSLSSEFSDHHQILLADTEFYLNSLQESHTIISTCFLSGIHRLLRRSNVSHRWLRLGREGCRVVRGIAPLFRRAKPPYTC